MKFKKLIPALAMLLVAAVLMGTSSFAWFSMNTSVTATGMQVNVKSDSTWLLINDEQTTATGIQSDALITEALTVSEADSKVLPSRPAQSATDTGYLTTSGKDVSGATITTAGVVVDNATKAAAVTNWYTAKATSPNASTIKADTARQLTSFTGYVIEKTVYLTVALGSNDANNLKVTATIQKKTGAANTDSIDGVRVLVATDDGGFAIITPAQSGTPIDIKGSNTALTDTTVRTVKIYLYYDGEDTAVYTNNAANLKAADISLAFDVDAVPAA